MAEAVLALLGVKVTLYERDPYVGFSRHIPHFVPDPESPGSGMMVTAENKRRVLNLQRFNARKAKGSYRIFCLGGSTTYGHPYADATSFCGWLRAMLPKADSAKSWELINCGGISYASYREALLMEELIQYEPDLFVVLSAHNEFLEQRTYGDIIAMPESLRGLGSILGRTRVYSALKLGLDRLHADPGRSGGGRSNQAPANLLAENPEAILDRTIGPQSYHRDETQQQRVIEHYRFNLARMAGMARSAGAEIIFISPASNLRHCAPFKSEHRSGLSPAELSRWEGFLRQAIDARQAQRWDESLRFADQAAAIDDRYAGLHYLRGQLLFAVDRFSEARMAFLRARDEDVCPLRALSAIVQATEGVAHQRGAPFVDFTRLIDAQSLHGIPGSDWFLDHVHPTIEGHRQLALELMRTLEKAGTLRPTQEWNEAARLAVKATVENAVTPGEHAAALVTLAKVVAWAGKGDEAYQISQRAAQLAPDDAAAQFELGKNAAHAGQRDIALRGLRRAVELNPRFVEALSLLGMQLSEAGQTNEALRRCREAVALRPDDSTLLLNLAEILRRAGQTGEAETTLRRALASSPNHAEARSNLAWALKDRGAYTEALQQFREALRLRPGAINPSLGLAWLLATHPDASQRNPVEAVRLGERLADLSGHQNWMALDTLAVAYAAAGRYGDAVKTAGMALELVKRASPADADDVAKRLAQFQQNQPFVEPVRAGGQ